MTALPLTIQQAHDRLRTGDLSSVALTQAVLDRIVALDNDLKAYLTLAPDMALEQAAEADRRRGGSTVVGCAAGDQGCHLRRRAAHHLRLAHPGRVCAAL
jgi:Asp-tRNA(Asn)/Glu-tRNA(Gln) amidotransferase A subunit family amidase